jgi:phosphatidylglycerol---prolipoprotein diacylglyceryl transferase
MLAFWVDNLSPFLIRFRGDFGIRYYGLGCLIGFLVGAWLLPVQAGRW